MSIDDDSKLAERVSDRTLRNMAYITGRIKEYYDRGETLIFRTRDGDYVITPPENGTCTIRYTPRRKLFNIIF